VTASVGSLAFVASVLWPRLQTTVAPLRGRAAPPLPGYCCCGGSAVLLLLSGPSAVRLLLSGTSVVRLRLGGTSAASLKRQS